MSIRVCSCCSPCSRRTEPAECLTKRQFVLKQAEPLGVIAAVQYRLDDIIGGQAMLHVRERLRGARHLRLIGHMISLATERPRRQDVPRLRDFAAKSSAGLIVAIAGLLGVLSFVVLLCSRNIADGDLWAKLSLGAHVWKFGTLPHHDMFAFTEVLPEYVDHEWGAGTIFFGLIKFFGSVSLMWLKVILACGAMAAAGLVGRRAGSSWATLLLLGIPAGACVGLGYVPVIRSHAFTYFFFALTLLCLEEIMNGRGTLPLEPWGRPERSAEQHWLKSMMVGYWPAAAIVGVMLVWVNVHGGFVAGLGTIAIYAGIALVQQFLPRMTRTTPMTSEKVGARRLGTLLAVAIGALMVTCINPYGVKFWSYLLPAVLAKRPLIAEWQPLPAFAFDIFMPFRILFLLVVVMVAAGWARTKQKSWTGLMMLAVTAFLAWRSRRHAPFFGVAALAFAGPYLCGTLSWLSSVSFGRKLLEPAAASATRNPDETRERRRALLLVTVYGLLALYAVMTWLPQASFQVLAPVGHDPVREADILSLAQAKGNLATPFHWGSYSAWRLHPNIRISMDGRYEAAYPESTFLLNARFFDKTGPDWDRLIRQYPVDYVLLDLSQAGLRPEDLRERGYVLIWVTEGSSALMALEKHAQHLLQVAAALPPTTIEPLDAAITDRWWAPN